MLLNTKDILVADFTTRVLLGKSTRETGLLETNELTIVAHGVRALTNYTLQHMPRAQKGCSSSKEPEDGFNTFRTYEEAIDVFMNNPQSIVKFNATELRPTDVNEAGPQTNWDVTGDFIDVGRYLEGAPESMGSMFNGVARTRRIRLLVDAGNSWDIHFDDINHRSERIIRLSDALERANVRSEISTVFSGQAAHIELIIKQFNETMSVEDIAIALHSEYFRRVFFRIMEYSDTWSSGYGSSTWMHHHINELSSQINDEITVYIMSNMRRSSIDTTFDRLEEYIETELSQSVPQNNLFIAGERGVEAKQIF